MATAPLRTNNDQTTPNRHDRAQLAPPQQPMDQHNLSAAPSSQQQQQQPQQQPQQQSQQTNQQQQQQQQQQQHPNSSPGSWLGSASAAPGAPTNNPPSAQAPGARPSDNPSTAFDPAFGAGYQYFPHLDSNQLLPGNPAGPGAPQPAGQDPLGPTLGGGPSSKLSGQKRGRDPDEADDGDGDFGGDWIPGADDARIGHNGQQVNGLPPPTRASNAPGAGGASGSPMKLTKTHTDPLISQALNTDGTPKRPMNAFMIFARKRRPEVAAENPALRTGEISKLLSKEWKTIDLSQKQFYLEKAKSLKDNFTALFPQYVYRRRPNHSRKKRKTEPDAGAGYGGLNARQEDSPEDHDDSPGPAPYMVGPSGYGHHHHMADPMGHRPGSAFDSQHSYAQPGHYGHVGHGGHRQGSGGPLRHFDGSSAGHGGWYDKAKIEPESPRMRNASFGNAMNGAPSNRSSSGTGYFSIPSPNFGPTPLPPGGRQSGSNPPSANHTPLLTPTPSITPAIPSSSMVPLAGGGSHPATNPPNGNWMSSASSLASYAHPTGATNGSHGPIGAPSANGGNFFDWQGNRSALPSPAPGSGPAAGGANSSGASQAASGRGVGGLSSYRGGQPTTVQGVLGGSGGPPPPAQAATAGRGSQW